ncbi:class I SAM-dependent methyltransferase [Psychroflexus sp. CAK1W]|uniref:methyltransferase domain-containing protein n=1 Tax=Psychroflexus curvus TaxID=2873595 RepID=UPI001CCC89A4|nr:methyltransferase domain-containing protein [Psychroflexus curvus]MBZ9628910.1 class I SAM-dependent methyltransferase [Psychroflexus curvus]
MKFKLIKNLKRGDWAEEKLKIVKSSLPNEIVSDIGSGWGCFKNKVESLGLVWQPFDYVQKLPEATLWDLNNPAPETAKKPGFIVLLEVYEHLANPELGIKNIASHIADGGYLAMSCPNPFYAKSKFTMIYKNQLYAFQPKHIEEHHVNVPLPHIIEFYLKKHGFELLEKGVIDSHRLPSFKFSFNYLKDCTKYILEKIVGGDTVLSKGETQVYFAKKTTH